tara:strand:+ start:302 stop:466 length:165 start_codon:yes stop_codon:yes gene_type:complete
MSQELKINKGVELMLRREATEDISEPYSGIKINHEISFLSKIFTLKFEFTWKGR